MAAIDNYELLNSDGPLWQKTEWFVFKAAGDITGEDPGTPNHANRLTWANAIFAGGMPALKTAAFELRLWVMQNATIQANGHGSTDADVEFVVNSNIDSVATG